MILGPGCLGLAGSTIAAALALAPCFSPSGGLGAVLGVRPARSGVGTRTLRVPGSGSTLHDMAVKTGVSGRFHGRGLCLLGRLGVCA